MTADKVKQVLKKLADKDKAALLARFFKTGAGQYGAGDKFLGVMVPVQRSVVKKFSRLPLKEIDKLLKSPYHEHRLIALLILVDKFGRAVEVDQRKIIKFYLSRTKYINNWDLVDLSAPKILGEWLVKHPDKNLLNRLAASKNLWQRRIAVLATFAFIKRKDLQPAIALAKKLLSDSHDLMHKAIGWMLREAGKRDLAVLKNFLNQYAARMPRTTLRYAIEHLPEAKKKHYLNLKS
jgi:3-methyladenine DNA glycosylase AlkD